MDKKKSILNVSVSLTLKIITLILNIWTKRVLIQSCGNEVNGLNALYLSIIGFFSVAELGVGTAITFCMYKPIVEGNQTKVSALYGLFRRLYLLIGGFILIAGLLFAPFISHFAKDYAELQVNLHLTFILMLLSVVLTYLFGAKTALINAYKNNYISTAITSGGIVLQNILQIAALYITGSFVWYLVCRILSALVQWIITEIIAGRKYHNITKDKQKLDSETKVELTKNIKAMFMHKIGGLLVNTLDSVVISAFIGVTVLGEYNNYTTIMASVGNIISFGLSSLTSTWGHLYAGKKELIQRYSEFSYLICFMAGVVFHLGYYAIIDNLIAILYEEELIIAKNITFVITINGFINFLRQNTLIFRDATGNFYYDRYKPLIEGTINIILSVFFVQWIGVIGAILATILTNLFICHIVEPYVLYKHAFHASPKKYYLQNYSFMILFAMLLILLDKLMIALDSQWLELLINGCIAVGIAVIFCAIILLLCKKEYKNFFGRKKQEKNFI